MRAQDGRGEIQAYLAKIGDDRARILRELRRTILANLPSGFTEEFDNGGAELRNSAGGVS